MKLERLLGGHRRQSPVCLTRRACRPVQGVLLLAIFTASAAHAVLVDSNFFGGADIAGATTYCWTKGQSAPNGEIERAIRMEVDEQLSSRGYRATECEAELHVATFTAQDDFFSGGALRIEVSMASTGKVAFRGTAAGVVAADKIKKRRRIATSAVKKMFKPFPKSRGSSPRGD